MHAQPASNIQKLTDTLNNLIESGEVSPFELKRLKKEAEKIKDNFDIASGFALFGMIACLENDIEAMHSFFKRAIQQSGSSPLHLVNYSNSLLYFNLYKDAYIFALQAYEKDPLYIEALDALLRATCVSGKKNEFEKYSEIWNKHTKQEHPLKTNPLHSVDQNAKSFLKEYVELKDIYTECEQRLIEIFGSPLHVILKIMPDSSHEPNLVAWIQSFDDIETGLEKYYQFEDWYINNDYDLKTDKFNFNIEFPEGR